MRVVELEKTLSREPHVKSIRRLVVRRGRLVDFALTGYWVHQGRNYPFYRVDCNHDRPHRHAFFLIRSDPRRRIHLETKTLQTLLADAENELNENWLRYWRAYVENGCVVNGEDDERCK